MSLTDSYRLAEPRDYQECHKAFGGPDWKFTFPTVVARRKDGLIGFLATTPHKTEIIAGRIWVKPSLVKVYQARTMIRLGICYEEILRAAGVSYYVIPMDADNPLCEYVEETLGLKPYAEAEDTLYYRKTITKKEAA